MVAEKDALDTTNDMNDPAATPLPAVESLSLQTTTATAPLPLSKPEAQSPLIPNSDTTSSNNSDPQKPPTNDNPKPKPKRRIIRRKKPSRNQPPPSILNNTALHTAISTSLPKDYEFEILKTVWRIQESKCTHLALQMPEGLLMYGCILSDIFLRFADSSHLKTISILGDVTYGACCVDDLGAQALGADLLVHYGHSCLVPVTCTVIKVLYVFVEIMVDVKHFCDCVCETIDEGVSVEVMGTVQFRSAIAESAKILSSRNRPAHIPQAKPLSPGEVLGCTAPSNLASNSHSTTVMLFLADGRFHLEAAMIANPTMRALRYDPYSKTLTEEGYETEKMKKIRQEAIRKAKDAKVFGVILGTLGRQGNPAILGRIRKLLRSKGKKSFVLLLSEIFPSKLDMIPQADAWVQVACPRLSIDWGHFFNKPVLNSYELETCLEATEWKDTYPMDFYSSGSGEWTNYHDNNRPRKMQSA